MMDDVQAGLNAARGEVFEAPRQASILLAEWRGPYGGIPPWDQVRPELFPDAIQAGIDEHRREVLAIAGNPEPPSFANTVEALERSGRALDRVLTLFWVMNSNVTDSTYQALQKEWSPKLAASSDEIWLNADLFRRIAALHGGDSAGLDARQRRLLTQLHDDFVSRGATLDPAQKQQLSDINQQLAAAFSEFSDKLLADENTHVAAGETEMAGVPDDVRTAAAAAARERGLAEGSYAVVNNRSAVDPILTLADDRALRERVWRAFVSRGDNADGNDTNATVARIVKLRADRARLLGFPSHADWRMRDTMAEKPERAMALMTGVWPAAVARVREEVADQEAMAKSLGHVIAIEPWDYRYYQEKVRKQRYDLSQDEIKPYFELSNLMQGMMWAAGELYDLDFTDVTGTVPVFHPDVRTFAVTDRRSGAAVGLYYLDAYARPSKRSGAWHSAYRTRSRLLGDAIVLNSNTNNFTKPAPGEPILLSLDEGRTLFHEFGHAIHFLLIDVRYPGLTTPPRDFIEFPSQVNENWLLTPELLDKFARHYRTGEPMPRSLIDKIQQASTFNQGMATVEYLSSALVDMKLHTDPDGIVDPDAFERRVLAEIGMPKELAMRHRLPQFSHLFSSDSYSGGYYSYLWSEVMDADAWAAFGEAGSRWDKATADRLRETLLAVGNEVDPAEAYRAFRGRDPSADALMARRGFPLG